MINNKKPSDQDKNPLSLLNDETPNQENKAYNEKSDKIDQLRPGMQIITKAGSTINIKKVWLNPGDEVTSIDALIIRPNGKKEKTTITPEKLIQNWQVIDHIETSPEKKSSNSILPSFIINFGHKCKNLLSLLSEEETQEDRDRKLITAIIETEKIKTKESEEINSQSSKKSNPINRDQSPQKQSGNKPEHINPAPQSTSIEKSENPNELSPKETCKKARQLSKKIEELQEQIKEVALSEKTVQLYREEYDLGQPDPNHVLTYNSDLKQFVVQYKSPETGEVPPQAREYRYDVLDFQTIKSALESQISEVQKELNLVEQTPAYLQGLILVQEEIKQEFLDRQTEIISLFKEKITILENESTLKNDDDPQKRLSADEIQKIISGEDYIFNPDGNLRINKEESLGKEQKEREEQENKKRLQDQKKRELLILSQKIEVLEKKNKLSTNSLKLLQKMINKVTKKDQAPQ